MTKHPPFVNPPRNGRTIGRAPADAILIVADAALARSRVPITGDTPRSAGVPGLTIEERRRSRVEGRTLVAFFSDPRVTTCFGPRTVAAGFIGSASPATK